MESHIQATALEDGAGWHPRAKAGQSRQARERVRLPPVTKHVEPALARGNTFRSSAAISGAAFGVAGVALGWAWRWGGKQDSAKALQSRQARAKTRSPPVAMQGAAWAAFVVSWVVLSIVSLNPLGHSPSAGEAGFGELRGVSGQDVWLSCIINLYHRRRKIPRNSLKGLSFWRLAGALGFEPRMAGPKPAALPLGYAPIDGRDR